MNSELLLRDEVYRIVGCAIEVLNGLGHGLHEKPYENALVVEFGLGGIPLAQQPRYPITYKGINVGEYVPDLIAFSGVVVDTKVIDAIQKLVLVTDRSGPVIAIEHARARFAEPLLNEVDNTGIAARRDTPLEAEIEICELFSRENFATAGLRPPSAFGILQATVLDDPAFARF